MPYIPDLAVDLRRPADALRAVAHPADALPAVDLPLAAVLRRRQMDLPPVDVLLAAAPAVPVHSADVSLAADLRHPADV